MFDKNKNYMLGDRKGTIIPKKDLLKADLNTTHIVNVKESNINLIANNKSEYKILIPASLKDDNFIKLAAEELQQVGPISLAHGTKVLVNLMQMAI